MLGTIEKGTKYRQRIESAVKLDPNHPIHHGVAMQAHHILSAEGVKQSGLGNDLVRFGYDINTLENLALIPSTLQGACHLGVQPHRGNHTALIERRGGDNDDDHPRSYHQLVAKLVRELQRIIVKQCPSEDPEQRRRVRNAMDTTSAELLRLVAMRPVAAPLTSVARHYSKGNPSGCGGVDSVAQHQGAICPVEHSHANRQGSGQRAEKITYRKTNAHQMKPGQ